MLDTPLGEIEIWIDDAPCAYHPVKVRKDGCCPDLGGRYVVYVRFVPDGRSHSISCFINGHTAHEKDGIESGENLELKSFYGGSCKLSIGMEGDSCLLPDGTRSGWYDYDTDYLEGGVRYLILADTKTPLYAFGIAWIDPVSEDNDVQTWYGADPYMISIL